MVTFRGYDSFGIELEYRIEEINGYKCRWCGEHFGSVHDDDEYSDTGFEGWKYCPYCGIGIVMCKE